MKIQTQRVGDLVLLEISVVTTDGDHVHIVQPLTPDQATRVSAMIADTIAGSDSLDAALDRILAT